MIIQEDKLNPLVLKIMNSIKMVKDDIPDSLLLMVTNYSLAEVSSNLRAKLRLYDSTVKPLNNYTYIFGESGIGKDISLTALNNIFITKFKEKMEIGFNKHKAKYWEQRTMTLVDEDCEDVEGEIKEEMRLVSPFSYRISSGTDAGVSKYRVTSGHYKIGAINLVVDEMGINYASLRSLIGLMLSTYEDGNSEARQLKESGYAAVSGVPSNFLGYSSPALAFDGGATEKMIIDDLSQGMGRRSFFAYVDKPERKELSAEERVKASRAKSDENRVHSKDIAEHMVSLAKPKYMYKEITLSEEAEIALAAYGIKCENVVKSIEDISDVEKIELLNRAWKATRLAGIYAFISKAEEVNAEFAEQAIYVAEISGSAFKRICNQPQAFERTFEFIKKRKKTSDVDLIKQAWFPKNMTMKRGMLSLARAYGYEQDYLFRLKEVEGVEFYSFVEVPKTDINDITISISKDLTKGYKKKKVPFDVIHEVICNPDFCYSMSIFKGGHRKQSNAQGGQTLLILDIDEKMSLNTAQMMFNNYKCMTATTRSHQIEKNGVVTDRFRIIFIMDRKLNLTPDDYKLFMQNMVEKLGVGDIVDRSCLEVGRGFYGANGSHWYSDGEKLIETADCIPSTQKTQERKAMLSSSGIGSLDGVERYLLEESIVGNRSNNILKYAMFIKDSGYEYRDAKEKVLDFNSKLPEPLTVKEITNTILKTLQRINRESKRK